MFLTGVGRLDNLDQRGKVQRRRPWKKWGSRLTPNDGPDNKGRRFFRILVLGGVGAGVDGGIRSGCLGRERRWVKKFGQSRKKDRETSKKQSKTDRANRKRRSNTPCNNLVTRKLSGVGEDRTRRVAFQLGVGAKHKKLVESRKEGVQLPRLPVYRHEK